MHSKPEPPLLSVQLELSNPCKNVVVQYVSQLDLNLYRVDAFLTGVNHICLIIAFLSCSSHVYYHTGIWPRKLKRAIDCPGK